MNRERVRAPISSEVDAHRESASDQLRAGRGIMLGLIVSAVLWGLIALVVVSA